MRKSGAVALVECGLKNGTISKPGDAYTGSNRVKRGGSWNNNARNCRSANCNRNNPSNTNNNIGFRDALPGTPRIFFEKGSSL